MYELNEIYNQADRDEVSIKTDCVGYEARLRQGIKITREGRDVHIFNTTKGVFYEEIKQEEYEIFYEYGWVIGVYQLALVNYKRKLNVIEERIRREVNTRKNDRHVKALKKSRTKILIDYRRITKKINKLL